MNQTQCLDLTARATPELLASIVIPRGVATIIAGRMPAGYRIHHLFDDVAKGVRLGTAEAQQTPEVALAAMREMAAIVERDRIYRTLEQEDLPEELKRQLDHDLATLVLHLLFWDDGSWYLSDNDDPDGTRRAELRAWEPHFLEQMKELRYIGRPAPASTLVQPVPGMPMTQMQPGQPLLAELKFLASSFPKLKRCAYYILTTPSCFTGPKVQRLLEAILWPTDIYLDYDDSMIAITQLLIQRVTISTFGKVEHRYKNLPEFADLPPGQWAYLDYLYPTMSSSTETSRHPDAVLPPAMAQLVLDWCNEDPAKVHPTF